MGRYMVSRCWGGWWNTPDNETHAPCPMADAPEKSNNSIVLSIIYSGAKFPTGQMETNLVEAGNNVIHGRTLQRVILHHIGNQGHHEFETRFFLIFHIRCEWTSKNKYRGARTTKKSSSDHVAKIVYVSWEGITLSSAILLKSRNGFIATQYRQLQRWAILRIVSTRQKSMR